VNLPLFLAFGVALIGIVGPDHGHPALTWTLLGAAVVVAGWHAALIARTRRMGWTLSIEWIARPQHYVQAGAQGLVLLYWGWYWRPAYDAAPLILAQLLFAYAIEMLLAWTRRSTHTLGFGPIPVIFSINLFLWFKPGVFYFQFLMVAVGLVVKEFVRWEKDGRRAHIFNPSSFPLAVFSVAMLLSGRSDLTWGQEIASTQFYPPQMHLFIFLVGMPGQLLFGVTTMTGAAVVATYLFGLAYYAATGVYFFDDSYIPIAVFLGMHLLFTDPSTSPRTELGRLIFGTLYGLSTVALYQLLGMMGLPTFYDKLLQVPVLNLSIKVIDRFAMRLRGLDPTAPGRAPAPRRRHLVYMSAWAMLFAAISAAGGVGDHHPGQWLPFWRQACAEGRPYACRYAADMQAGFCEQGSRWACEAHHGARSEAGEHPLPALEDYPVILRGSKGPVRAQSPANLRVLACRQGWAHACVDVLNGQNPTNESSFRNPFKRSMPARSAGQ
jgi:hypothetical protein